MNKKTKIISFLSLQIAMVVSAISISTVSWLVKGADLPGTEIEGGVEKLESYFSSEGDTHFLIKTPQDFKNLSKLYKSASNNDINILNQQTFKVCNDINLDDASIAPIGSIEKPFTATIKSNDVNIQRKIYNFSVDGDGCSDIGIFGYTKDSTISNLLFDNVIVDCGSKDESRKEADIGFLVGHAGKGCAFDNFNIKNCQFSNSYNSNRKVQSEYGYIGRDEDNESSTVSFDDVNYGFDSTEAYNTLAANKDSFEKAPFVSRNSSETKLENQSITAAPGANPQYTLKQGISFSDVGYKPVVTSAAGYGDSHHELTAADASAAYQDTDGIWKVDKTEEQNATGYSISVESGYMSVTYNDHTPRLAYTTNLASKGNFVLYTTSINSPITELDYGGVNNVKIYYPNYDVYLTSLLSLSTNVTEAGSFSLSEGREKTIKTSSNSFIKVNGTSFELASSNGSKFTFGETTSKNTNKDAGINKNRDVPSRGTNKTLTFGLASNPGGWPTTASSTLTNYTYTLNGTAYTFGLKNVKCNSGYLMMNSTAALGLPAIEDYKLTKVVAKNSSSCSTSTKVGISSSADSANYISGGAIQTWSTTSSTYTYNLSGTSDNTVYYVYVTNKNAQIIELTLTYESSGGTISVTGVTLDKTSLTMDIGDEQTLTATVSPNDASDRSVSWTSSNTGVATVSNGLVTAVAAGSATITVTTTDGNKTATCNVTVNEPAPVGEKNYTKVETAPVDWSGTYLLVYESNGNALVWTGVDAGQCRVETTISNKKISKPSGAAEIIVEKNSSGNYGIKVNDGVNKGNYIRGTNGSNALSFVDTFQTLTIEILSGSCFITSNTSVMRYNSASGDSNERFRFYKSTSYTSQQPVQLYKKDDAKPASITLLNLPDTVKVGDSGTVSYDALNTKGEKWTGTVSYSSSNSTAIEVNESTGAYTVKKYVGGAVSITVSIPNTEISDTGNTSIVYLSSLTLSGAPSSPYYLSTASSTGTLSYTGKNNNDQSWTGTVSYSSNNSNVISIDSSTGAYTISGSGQATLTCTAPNSDQNGNNFSTSVTIIVYKETTSLTVTFDNETVSNNDTKIIECGSSGHSIVATVNTGAETATITAQPKDSSTSASDFTISSSGGTASLAVTNANKIVKVTVQSHNQSLIFYVSTATQSTITNVSILGDYSNLYEGSSATLTANVTAIGDAKTDYQVSWSCSNTNKITITDNHDKTATIFGKEKTTENVTITLTITSVTADNSPQQASISVQVKQSTITFNKSDNIDLLRNEPLTVSATTSPANLNLEWIKSSGPNNITINNSGTVSAGETGTAVFICRIVGTTRTKTLTVNVSTLQAQNYSFYQTLKNDIYKKNSDGTWSKDSDTYFSAWGITSINSSSVTSFNNNIIPQSEFIIDKMSSKNNFAEYDNGTYQKSYIELIGGVNFNYISSSTHYVAINQNNSARIAAYNSGQFIASSYLKGCFVIYVPIKKDTSSGSNSILYDLGTISIGTTSVPYAINSNGEKIAAQNYDLSGSETRSGDTTSYLTLNKDNINKFAFAYLNSDRTKASNFESADIAVIAIGENGANINIKNISYSESSASNNISKHNNGLRTGFGFYNANIDTLELNSFEFKIDLTACLKEIFVSYSESSDTNYSKYNLSYSKYNYGEKTYNLTIRNFNVLSSCVSYNLIGSTTYYLRNAITINT